MTKLDYTIKPLLEPVVGKDFNMPADPYMVIVECIVESGDLCTTCSFVTKKSEVNSKAFILKIVEHFFICNATMKLEKAKRKAELKS